MTRVFLGIDLPDNLKFKIENLVQSQRLNSLPIKLVERGNFHAAIKFLDDLTDEQIASVIKTVEPIIRIGHQIRIQINDSLVFPNLNFPRVLALKVTSPELISLTQEIINHLDALPFIQPENRKYTPHITLARIKDNLTPAEKEKIAGLKFSDEFNVGSIQLFKSELTQTGPIYSIIKQFKLNG